MFLLKCDHLVFISRIISVNFLLVMENGKTHQRLHPYQTGVLVSDTHFVVSILKQNFKCNCPMFEFCSYLVKHDNR
jgi:hypothetical protein